MNKLSIIILLWAITKYVTANSAIPTTTAVLDASQSESSEDNETMMDRELKSESKTMMTPTSSLQMKSFPLARDRWMFSIVVGSDSRSDDVQAAYNTFSVPLLVECVVAVIILVLACCFKEKRNKAVTCGLTLAGAANFVTAFFLIRTFDSHYEHTEVPPTWILFIFPGLFLIIACLVINKVPLPSTSWIL
jgi:hypothetical protein